MAIQATASMATIMVPVLAPAATAQLSIRLAYLGVFMAIVYIGAMAASLASGEFIVRYGPIRVSQCCLIFCGAGLAGTAMASVPLMIPAALLIGLGYGPVTPASSHILARTAPPRLMSLTFSIKQTGVPIGGAMAGALVPPLVLFLGWRGASLVIAGGCFLLAVMVEPIRAIFDTDLEQNHRMDFAGVAEPLKMVVSMAPIRELALISFFFAVMQTSLNTYFVSFLTTELNASLVRAGLMLSVALTAGVIGRIAWGGIADRLVKPRKMLGILGIIMSTSAAATFSFKPPCPDALLLVVSACFGASAVGWNGVYLAEVARLAPPGKAGMATGGNLFFSYFGAVIAPPLFGALAGPQNRYSFAYLLFAVPIFLFGLVLVRPHGQGRSR